MMPIRSVIQYAVAALAITASAAPLEPSNPEVGVETINVTESRLEARSPNSCYANSQTIYISYDIWAENFYDIAGRCNGLWANLRGWSNCGASMTYCGGIESTHILNWKFRVPIGCNKGIIESVWWEATKNEFGAIHC